MPDLSRTRQETLKKFAKGGTKIDILVSYSIIIEKPSIMERIKNLRKFCGEVMLDSGAYHILTGFRDKRWFESIILKYANFVNQNRQYFDYVVAPDIPGDSKATIKNTIIFSSKVENFVPVLQGNSKEEYLGCFRQLENLGFISGDQPLGIGNMASFRDSSTDKLERVLSTLDKKGIKKIHLFGANLKIIKKLGNYLWSCDISSWQREIAFRRRTVHRARTLVDANYKAILTYLRKIRLSLERKNLI